MTATADVVVIGAGVVGASTALALSRRGHRVLVLDRAPGPGQGSTAQSSAIIRFNYSTWAGVAIAWSSRHGWQEWAEFLEYDDPEGLARLHTTGSVMLDVPTIPREPTLANFDRAGVRYEEWDAETLAARVPGIDVGRWFPPVLPSDDAFFDEPAGRVGAVFTPDGGYVDDPALAAGNLARAAAARGAAYTWRATVTGLARVGEAWRIELADGDVIEAPVVVNAAGPWSPTLNRLAGADADFTVAQRPLRQEVYAAAGAGRDASGEPLPVLLDMDIGSYFRSDPAGGLLVGFAEPDCDPLEWLDNADDCDPHASAAGFEGQLTRVAKRLPDLGVPSHPLGIAGVYDTTTDWTPIYDRSAVDGFYLACGTSGNQFKNAPVVGDLMADLIEAVEAGHDHDADPITHTCRWTGLEVDLATFSRKRPLNTASTGTVLG